MYPKTWKAYESSISPLIRSCASGQSSIAVQRSAESSAGRMARGIAEALRSQALLHGSPLRYERIVNGSPSSSDSVLGMAADLHLKCLHTIMFVKFPFVFTDGL